MDNPFIDYNRPVENEHFFGRKKELRYMENNFKNPNVCGNISIVGLQHIGKTSLVLQSVIGTKATDHLVSKKILPIYLRLATLAPDDGRSLFRYIATLIIDKMQEISAINETIELSFSEISNCIDEWHIFVQKINNFFKTLRLSGWNVVIVLDEFDEARNLYHKKPQVFQQILNLIDMPSYRVTFIVLSRRLISEIEEESAGCSILNTRFHPIFVSMFTDDEVDEILQRLNLIELPPNELIREKANYMCGGHPFLLNRFCYAIAQQWIDETSINLPEICSWQGVSGDFYRYYEHITNLLKIDGSFVELLSAIFGPQGNITKTNLNNFLQYGLICEGKRGYYEPFSEHFKLYLEHEERSIDLWKLWSQAEQELRNLITKVITKKYGVDGFRTLSENNPQIKSILNDCGEKQRKESKNFRFETSTNLIDYTYPMDLWKIISIEWSEFASILGEDKSIWGMRFTKIAKVRTPMAHNRELLISKTDRQEAESYCGKILERMKFQP